MTRFQPNVFETIELDDLFETISGFKECDYRFVQICATTLEDSCGLLYTFIAPDAANGCLTGLVVNVPDGMPVPSITELYPAAFVFENETHDLFGVDIYGINLDFQGEFYKVAQKFPMNPRAAEEQQATKDKEASDE